MKMMTTYIILGAVAYFLCGFAALAMGYKIDCFSINRDQAGMQKFLAFFVWPVVLLIWATVAAVDGVNDLAKKLS